MIPLKAKNADIGKTYLLDDNTKIFVISVSNTGLIGQTETGKAIRVQLNKNVRLFEGKQLQFMIIDNPINVFEEQKKKLKEEKKELKKAQQKQDKIEKQNNPRTISKVIDLCWRNEIIDPDKILVEIKTRLVNKKLPEDFHLKGKIKNYVNDILNGKRNKYVFQKID